MRHSPQTTRFAVLRTEFLFQFTRYPNEMSYQNENFVRIENRNELILERLVRDLTSSRYHVNRYREIYGDGMKLNELVLE